MAMEINTTNVPVACCLWGEVAGPATDLFQQKAQYHSRLKNSDNDLLTIMSANRTENLKQEGAVINSLSKQARNNLPAAPNIYHPGENISSGSYNTSGTNHSHTLEHHHRVTPNPELNQQPKLKSAAQYRTNRKSQPVRSYACFTPLPTRYPPRWGTKPGAKKSFVWKYFFHPELSMGLRDLAHTQCTLCDSQLAFNTSGTTTTMLNHLKSRHAEVVEQEQQRLHQHQQFQQQQQQQHNQRKQTYQQSTIPSASLIGKISQSYLREGITEQPFSHLWLRNQHVYSRTGTIRRGHRGRPPGSWRRVHQISRPIIQSPKDERQQPGGTQSYQMTPRSTRTVVSSLQTISMRQHTKNTGTDSSENGRTQILENPNYSLESVENKLEPIDSTCLNQIGVNMDLNTAPDPAALVRLSLWMRMFGGHLTGEKLMEMRSHFLKTLQPNNERLAASNTHSLCCSKRLPGTSISLKSDFLGSGLKSHLLESENHDGPDQNNQQLINFDNFPYQNAIVTFPSFQPRSTISLMKPNIQPCQSHVQLATDSLFSCGLENLKITSPELLRSHQNRHEVDAKSLMDPLTIHSTPWFAPLNWQTMSCPNATGFGQGSGKPKGNVHIVSPGVSVTSKSKISTEKTESSHWTLSNGATHPLDLSFKTSAENDGVQSMKDLRSNIIRQENHSTENNLNPVRLRPFCENLPIHAHSKQFHRKSSCPTSSVYNAEHGSTELYQRNSESIGLSEGITTSCCTSDTFSRRKRSRPSQLSLDACLNVEYNESSKCPKPESGSPLIFAVDQLKISSDIQGHDYLTNVADYWSEQPHDSSSDPRRSPHGPWEDHHAQTKEPFKVVPDRDGSFSISDFHYKLAYFLIRDAHPAEVLQDSGFKTLILTLLTDKQGPTAKVSDFWIPSAWNMRHQILRRLCDTASRRLEMLIRQQLHRTCSPIPDCRSVTDTDSTHSITLCQTLAFTVELWNQNTSSPFVHSAYVNQDELYADISVHLPLHGTEEHRLFYCTRKVSSAYDLRSALRVCSEQFGAAQSNTQISNIILPIGRLFVTTNNSKMLTEVDKCTPNKVGVDQTNVTIVPIPCLVTVLLNATEEAFNLPQFEHLMRFCQLFIRETQYDHEEQKIYKRNTANTFSSSASINEQTAHNSPELVRSESTGKNERDDIRVNREAPFPSPVYSKVFRLLQAVDRKASSAPVYFNNVECAQTILHTLKPVYRIINFFSHPHLFTNAAMVLPFLYSLRHHFDSAPPNHNTESSCVCKLFLQTIHDRLSDCYLKEGFVHETLLSATYLDPRLKGNLMCSDPNSVAITLSGLLDSLPTDPKGQAPQSPEETHHGIQGSDFLTEKIIKEMTRFHKEPAVSLNSNPFDWWRNNQHIYPTLAKTAFQFLNISPVSFTRLPRDDAHSPLSIQSKPRFVPTPTSSNQSPSLVNEVTQLLYDVNISCEPPPSDQFGVCSTRQSTVPTKDIPDYCFLWHNWMHTSSRDLDQ